MKEKSFIIAGAVVIAFLLGLVSKQELPSSLAGGNIDQISTTLVNNISVGTAAVNVVSSTGANRLIQIESHGTSPVFCLLDGAVAATDSTVSSTAANPIGFTIGPIGATTSSNLYEIRGYSGNVNCISAAAVTTTVTIGR